ncbi:MAG: mechanosensitive ion channel domain-containing protein [Reichenbachiella sp.]|uniref:mechanosensitive ion channel family protein n=1 Tax=Reichenbachiella sp. TaxID=2184521 RepID=UPI003264910D
MNFNINEGIGLALNKIETWLESLAIMLPNLVVAVIVLIAFFFVARFTRSLTNNVLNRFSNRAAVNSLFTTLIHILTIGIGLVIALNVLQLERTITSLLAGAGILGLALGFAFQDIAANFISGILMAFRQPIKVGDIIETNDYLGKVEDINLRVTILRTFEGLNVIIPNRDVFQKPLTNYTKTNDRRIELELGVSYADDLEKVQAVTEKAIGDLPFLLKGRDVNLYFSEFGSSSINFQVMFWVEYPDQPGFLRAKSEAIIAIKKAFDENDITIPFPIRTLDFGIKGGEKLSEMEISRP